MLVEKIKNSFSDLKINLENTYFLIATSGGPDSMVLSHVMQQLGAKIQLAHVNFGLRGQDSHDDEKFLSEYAEKNELNIFIRRVNTKDEMLDNESVQMAARRIRYAYFKELMQLHNIQYCLTAHHLDDNIETFFINLTRGSGLNGLQGMKSKTNSIIRPMLDITKSEILSYAFEHEIDYRIDKSNAENIYQRNLLRNEVLPTIFQHFPAFRIKMGETFKYMKDAILLMNEAITDWKKTNISKSESTTYIDKKALIKHPAGSTILVEILYEFGFQSAISADIYKNLTSNTGAAFQSGDHTLLINRDKIEINQGFQQFSTQYFKPEDYFDIFISDEKPDFIDNPPKNVCILDANKMADEIIVRTWRKADQFYPTGMTGRKKLSDFYIDNKLSRIDKEKQMLLCLGEEIAWIVNRRVDRRFAPDMLTTKYAVFQLRENSL